MDTETLPALIIAYSKAIDAYRDAQLLNPRVESEEYYILIDAIDELKENTDAHPLRGAVNAWKAAERRYMQEWHLKASREAANAVKDAMIAAARAYAK